MKLFDFFHKKVSNAELNVVANADVYNTFDYTPFSWWLDSVLEKSLPNETVAINFNLYEDGKSHWSLEFVATSSFDKENDDWACDELFTTRDNPFKWQEDCDFNRALHFVEEIIRRYLAEGKYKDELIRYSAIGVGFVDGDILLVYEK